MKYIAATVLALIAAGVAQPGLATVSTFTAKPTVGNNTFTAVFDATIGERITVISSAVGCTALELVLPSKAVAGEIGGLLIRWVEDGILSSFCS